MEQHLAHEGVSRRGLLKLVMTAGLGLAAAGTVDPAFAYADGLGLSRDGVKARFFIGSDLHVNNNTGAEPRDADKKLQFAFDTAYALDPELDAFCLVGDLTDNGNEGQYTRLMSLINDGGAHNVGYADGAGHTQMILCQGNHETYSPGVSGAPARFKEYTGQDATKVVDVNGVTVITMGPAASGSGDGDYRPHYDWFAEQLAEHVGNTTEPFLVLTHHQMRGSSYTSPEWHGTFGQGEERDFQKLMAQYPKSRATAMPRLRTSAPSARTSALPPSRTPPSARITRTRRARSTPRAATEPRFRRSRRTSTRWAASVRRPRRP